MAVQKDFFKYNPETDGNLTFNIDKALNENWDKVNEGFRQLAGKENKPSTVTSVVSAVGWNGNVYSFENIYPSDMYRVSIEPDNTCTADEISAWGMALMAGSATTNVLTALGDVPTVDIPVILTITAVSSDSGEPILETTTSDTGYYLDTGTNTYNLGNVVSDESQLDGTNYNFDIL